MPERYEFQRELDVLHKDLTKMGAVIEKTMDDMIEALITQNIELAQQVIDRDEEIDEMELKVERECILLIARQQPIASDLRDIAAVLKIITDLERIADHCADISEYTVSLSKENYIKPVVHIPEMVEKVKQMVKDAIDCSVKKDLELARSICARDDEIDNYFDTIIEELIELMKENSDNIRQCKDFMFIVKYLERMGDHATNIAEWIIYTVTGSH
ncbi:MAG: phosphate transport system regulatory protein PhoU [Firmicutes bacterium HGW-Firmicutes-1]|jgi:phosphate transport system protein|nr:MAG: phosphate transport system regulatory protein PhoU [Firmicutes bacterium HGW-Firmicutes-1]